MKEYITAAVALQDQAHADPPWMDRLLVWSVDGYFQVDCRHTPLLRAANLLLAALVEVLRRSGRSVEVVPTEDGSAGGVLWKA